MCVIKQSKQCENGFFLPTLHRRRRRYCVSLHFGNLEDGHFSLSLSLQAEIAKEYMPPPFSHSFAAIWWLAFAGFRRDRSGSALFCVVQHCTASFLLIPSMYSMGSSCCLLGLSCSLSVPALGIGRGVVGVISIIVDDDDVLGRSATAAAAAVSLHTSSTSLPEFFWTLRKREREREREAGWLFSSLLLRSRNLDTAESESEREREKMIMKEARKR